MSWLNKLSPKERRGSRPRCVLLTDGSRGEVADRLTRLVNLPDVLVTPKDEWMPKGKSEPEELVLTQSNSLVSSSVRRELTKWWLGELGPTPNTPNWDIASTCVIDGESGLILVEAKAHTDELIRPDKGGRSRIQRRDDRIGQSLAEATAGLKEMTPTPWHLSRDHHYQLSNRFAWSWKLATLGIPVVLVYLGFLNAHEMDDIGELFSSESDWERVLREHCEGVVDNTCWERRLDFDGVPMFPIIRVFDQPFDP